MCNGIRMSESVDKILPALIAAQHEVGRVGKSATNKFDNYNYANLKDYKDTYAVILQKHDLGIVEGAPTSRIVEGGRTTSKGKSENAVLISLDTMIVHNSGQWIIVPMQGEGQDRADKSTYKAITGARKYARACLLDLVTTDDPEGDETVGTGDGTSKSGQTQASADPPEGETKKPFDFGF